ncbi:hypothetical protein [Allopusillimonas ginsengisoli]|uniref:hypothetical protein n=1 Tax=Allopusillimonas ginsengisoli TaxID=453575 RepID=UPI001020628B|nr:hypothetical protein [Allopusillimonas ginsengisoli]TEA78090.1 hypothetical protein ERE07_11860 [Allopusillimonas ginsengisoli]
MRKIITCLDIYVTKSGHVAFIQLRRESEAGEPTFHGYLMDLKDGRSIKRELVWLESGYCVSSGQERDQIVYKA